VAYANCEEMRAGAGRVSAAGSWMTAQMEKLPPLVLINFFVLIDTEWSRRKRENIETAKCLIDRKEADETLCCCVFA